MAKSSDDRISELLEAIRPLVEIADEYDRDGLDEARPSWIAKGVSKYNPNEELYCGRGGKRLLTLEQALHARDVATDKKHPRPETDDLTFKIRQMYEAGLPNLGWEQMSEERRESVIANYKALAGLK